MPAMTRFARVPALLAAACCAWLSGALTPSLAEERAGVLRVAVAANFRGAAQALARRFEAQSSVAVLISSASTGVLAAQIRRGAPFDLLLAADTQRPARLHRDGFAASAGACYARGSLVLLGAQNIDSALANAELSVALANPRSAPYGAAALAVLARPGFAGPHQRRLVMGSNVQQAAQFFARGGADLALVARAVARGQGLPIPPAWHPAIEQHALVLSASRQPALARSFQRFITGAVGRAQILSFGYRACP